MIEETHSALTSERSGFWRRFAAALIDGIALGVVSGIAALAGLTVLWAHL